MAKVRLISFQYRHAVGGHGNGGGGGNQQTQMRKNASSRSFQAFGFGANQRNREETQSQQNLPRRGSNINVNIAPTIMESDTPEIRKYKKRFNSDILCAALWGEYRMVLSLCCNLPGCVGGYFVFSQCYNN